MVKKEVVKKVKDDAYCLWCKSLLPEGRRDFCGTSCRDQETISVGGDPPKCNKVGCSKPKRMDGRTCTPCSSEKRKKVLTSSSSTNASQNVQKEKKNKKK